MLFHEPFFALFIGPIFLAIYLALNNAADAKKILLIVASIAFYAWGEPLFVPVVLVSTAFDYFLSHRMMATPSPAMRKFLVMIGILSNLGILVFYKYADFIAANLNLALKPLGGEIPLLHIALPIGVSFVVFEKISYLIDTYRGTSKPAATLKDYSLFVFLFPKLLAGPILKYHEMERQIADPATITSSEFTLGFFRFARGAAKKVLIADQVGGFADRVFSADATTLSAGDAALGLICFSLQIYFDFSAYSDMAIGLARMLGFQLRENFRMPYAARSLTEFWRRWHISLTTWIRDYLYVPLGGNRNGEFRTYLNLWICFLASGIWHGASWNFVLWGAYNGLFLTLDRIFLLRWLERAGGFVSVIVTLLIVTFGWAIFRTTSVEQLMAFTAAIFGQSAKIIDLDYNPEVPLAVVVGTLLSLLPATPLYPRLERWYAKSRALQITAAIAIVILFVWACGQALSLPFKPFIYFRF